MREGRREREVRKGERGKVEGRKSEGGKEEER